MTLLKSLLTPSSLFTNARLQMSDEDLGRTIPFQSSFLSKVIEKAYDVMQTEMKDFLRACLQEHLSKGKAAEEKPGEKKNESKIFSFGVLEGLSGDDDGDDNKKDKKDAKEDHKKEGKDDHKKDAAKDETKPGQPTNAVAEETNAAEAEETPKVELSARYTDMPAYAFVSTVLFPMTNTTPQVQHALVFRRSVDRFTRFNDARQQELASLTGEKIVTKRKFERQELAIEFLDKAIQDTVLPSLQQDAVRGTIIASEMQDAFEPPAEGSGMSHNANMLPMEVPMVQACEGMLEKTSPLFLAIHRKFSNDWPLFGRLLVIGACS